MSAADCENPFCLEPIRRLAKFFGRGKEIRRALSFLHRGQCVSVVGPAKIGKTSFLFHIAHPLVRARHGLAEGQAFIHLDSYSLAHLDEGACYLHIREEAIRQVKSTLALDKEVGIRLERAVREAGAQTAYFGLRTLFQSSRALDLKLALVLDHLDVLNRNHLLGQEFFTGLRSLHTNYDIAYLVASRSPIDRLERICPDGPGSPFFNIFQPISIGPFTDEESDRLVGTLLDLAGARLPEFAIDCILELGRNDPCCIQWAGHIAFQAWQENGGDLQEEHCEKIRQRFSGIGA
jgi:hypothetical protein